MNQNNKKNYLRIMNDIKKNETVCPINIYCGDVNGEYNYNLSDDTVTSVDTIISDGAVELGKDEEGNNVLKVSEASYVIINTYSNNDEGIPSLVNYSIIFEQPSFGYFQALLLSNNESELFERIIGDNGYVKGSTDDFPTISGTNKVTISPIKKKARQRVRKGN